MMRLYFDRGARDLTFNDTLLPPVADIDKLSGSEVPKS
jgi:hypothetical protein